MANPDEYHDETNDEFDLGAAADAAFDEVSDEVDANDEVLVFQMEDEDGPQLPDGVADGEGVAAYALPPEVDDEFSELGDEWDARVDGEEFVEAAPAPDRRKAVAAATVLGAVAAALVMKFAGGGEQPTTDDVAVAPRGNRPVVQREVATESGPVAAVDTASGAGSAREPRSMVAGLHALFGGDDAAVASLGYEESIGPDGGSTEPSTGELAVTDGGTRARREGVVSYRDQVVLPGPLSNVAFASDTALESIWTRATLPPDGATGERFLQTPFVGSVRVHTAKNEFFDGRLVGLGGGRLVLDARAGELTLEAGQIVGAERLVDADLSGGGLVARTTGERVRVHVAGGWLRGHVVSREGETITLLLDSGGRITVERSDVQPEKSRTEIRLAQVPAGT